MIMAVIIWGYLYLSFPDVVVYKNTNPESSALIEFRKNEAKTNGKNLNIKLKWISYNKIPVTLRKAIVVAEDASFWVHKGFDWFEVKESIFTNLTEGEYSRGASTITQQLAKNLFLSPQKSIFRKVVEVYLTMKLEKNLSKTRILELYMNIIEFGEGIFGTGRATDYYFGKYPPELTVSEIVRLAAVIPSPLRLRPDKPSNGLKWRSKIVLERLYYYKFITESEYLQARQDLENFFEI